MKKAILISLVVLLSLIGHAQVSKSVVSTAGGLATTLNSTELSTVTDLTVTGTIDARDFVTMYNMPVLAVVDLAGVNIDAFTGTGGPGGGNSIYPANTIPMTAFRIGKSGKASLKSIVLPNTLTTIGNLAFQDCNSLTSVTMSTGITTILNSAFYNCTALNTITLPSTLTTIEYYAFQNCGLLSLNIPASVTSIGTDAFSGCKAVLTVENTNANYSSQDGVLYNKMQTSLIHCPISKVGSYTIPSTVITIESNAFGGCTALTEIIVPPSVNAIKSAAFSGCSGLTSLSFPSLVTTITNSVLYNCTSLNSVTIPGSVSTIEYRAFGFCTALNAINLSPSVTSIVNDAFLNCGGSINVDTNNSNYSSDDGLLYNKAKTILYHCPTSKTGVCIIPTTVTTIMAASFQGCGQLTSITIPASTTAIGQFAFAFCNGLTTIYANPVIPVNLTNSYGVFETITKNTCALIVPAGSLDAYRAANTWSNFTNIVQDAPVSTLSVSTSTLNVPAIANSTATFDITSNVLWTVSSDQTWLTVSAATGSNNATITVTTAANTLTTVRTATVIVSATGLTSKTVTITQAAATTPTLSVSTGTLNIASSNNSNSTFDISSNISWTVNSDQAWLTVNTGTGSNNATITITAAENTLTTTRTATVTVSGTGVTSKTVTITQAAATPATTLTVSTSTLDVPYTASYTSSFNISSNTTWTVTSDQTWLTVSAATGSNNATITITATENNAATYRIAIVTVSASGMTSKTVTITQAALSTTPTLSISPSALTVNTEGSLENLSITSNTSWTLSTNQSWLTFSRTSGENNGVVTLYVANNSTQSSRVAIVTLSSAGLTSQTLTVTQLATILSLNTNSVAILGAADSETKVDVTSNVSWTATPNQSWLTANPSVGNEGTSTLTLTASANTGADRTATVTLKATGANDQTIYVTQFSGIIVSQNVNVVAGGLFNALNATEKGTITNLTITGTIDARDFVTFRSIPNLSVVDLSGVTIAAYTGTEGTHKTYMNTASYSYPANSIPYTAFSYATTSYNSEFRRFSSVILPSSITSIDEMAFNNCYNLTSMAIPASVTSIGSLAFNYCSGLTSIVIPASVTSIGKAAFRSCTSLTTLNIATPSDVISIGESAFEDCRGLISIDFPSAQTTLAAGAFNSCTGLTSLTIPASVSSFSTAFQNCTGLKTLTVLTSNIENYAFTGCTGLTTLNVPSSSTIGIMAFGGCTSLTTLNIASSIIGDYAFFGCTGLTSLVIPTTVTSIGVGAFYLCNGLTTISIPASVTSIGSMAFYANCNSITVDANNPNYSSADGVLFNKTKTTLIKCPTSKTGSYSISTAIYNIEMAAFADCKALSTVSIPSTVLSIGNGVFINCSAMINVDASNTYFSSLDGVLFNKNQTTLIQCPISKTGNYSILSSVIAIGGGAFSSCTGLTSIDIPGSVTSIGSSAFIGCSSLLSVTIPSSVTTIGSSAFSGCTGLSSIYSNATSPDNVTLNIDVFNKVNKYDCTLYVPAGSKAVYSIAMYWQDFQNIVETTTTAIPTLTNANISLYPNPIIEIFRISGFEGIAKLSLIDMNGKTLLTKQVADNEDVSVSSLSKGLYFVKIATSNGTVVKKLVKQ